MLSTSTVKKRIFISKPMEEVTALAEKCAENNSLLIAASLIDFEAVPFHVDAPFDVLFIGSIRAARFFMEQYPIPENVQIACIGSTTARKINELGIGVSFIGQQASNPIMVGETFRIWLGERRVFFPISTESKRTISSCIPSEQREEKIVYRTFFVPQQFDQMDVYIFTSPSNVESYMQIHSQPRGTIVAWGETTRKALHAVGIEATKTLVNGDLAELIDYLISSHYFL